MIPVLMYHALADAAHPSGLDDPAEELYTLTTEAFATQLAWLSDQGFSTLLFADILAGMPVPDRAVILTFDDGHASNHTLALPLLRRFGMRAEFFITTNRIDWPNYLQEWQIAELAAAGMGIGSHGASHAYLSDLDDSALVGELRQAKERLQKIVNAGINSYSAPGGRLSTRVMTTATRLGYRLHCSSAVALWQTSESVVPRTAIKKGTPLTEFQKIARGGSRYYLWARARYLILKIVKTALGNRLYAALHRRLAA